MARVLVIDDERPLCTIMESLIERMGHDAVHARTLGAGIETAADDSFDVVLLDVHLPDGNGLDAIPTLRSLPSSPEIIIITGFGDPDGAELAI